MSNAPFGARTTRVPWGFVNTTDKGLTAHTTYRERYDHSILGDFAIELLGKLGIGEETLWRLEAAKDPLEMLRKIQSGEPVAEPAAETVPVTEPASTETAQGVAMVVETAAEVPAATPVT